MIERVESRDGVLTMTATASNTSPLPVWRTTDRGILTELCGEITLDLPPTHCMFASAHNGPHSWDPALKPLAPSPIR
jgi:hypothetical protein